MMPCEFIEANLFLVSQHFYLLLCKKVIIATKCYIRFRWVLFIWDQKVIYKLKIHEIIDPYT